MIPDNQFEYREKTKIELIRGLVSLFIGITSSLIAGIWTGNKWVWIISLIFVAILLTMFLTKKDRCVGMLRMLFQHSGFSWIKPLFRLIVLFTGGSCAVAYLLPMPHVIVFDDSLIVYHQVYVAAISGNDMTGIHKGYQCDDDGVVSFSRPLAGFDCFAVCKVDQNAGLVSLTRHYKIRGQLKYSLKADKPEYQIYHVKSVFFDFAKSEIREDQNSEMKDLADLLKENPDYQILVFGHTDDIGGDEYNDKLSEQRVKRCLAELQHYRVGSRQLLNLAFGERLPMFSENGTKNKNRRVDIFVVKRVVQNATVSTFLSEAEET